MVKKNDLLSDITKLAGSLADSAIHSVSGAKKRISKMSKDKIDEVLTNHNFVPREEFEVLKKLIQKCVLNQEKLDKRLSLLEKPSKSKASPKSKSKA